jgi:hypothetical protein
VKLIKNIFAILASSIILLGSNGFILEQYFCSGCNSERQEIAFFEFGEISHNHEHCNTCIDLHNECSCHTDDHLNNTEIKYIALDIIFSNSEKPIISKSIVKELKSNIFNNFLIGTSFSLSNLVQNQVMIPPLIEPLSIIQDICILNSVLRL